MRGGVEPPFPCQRTGCGLPLFVHASRIYHVHGSERNGDGSVALDLRERGAGGCPAPTAVAKGIPYGAASVGTE